MDTKSEMEKEIQTERCKETKPKGRYLLIFIEIEVDLVVWIQSNANRIICQLAKFFLLNVKVNDN